MKKLFPFLTATFLALSSFGQDQHLVESLQTQLKNCNARRLQLQIKSPSLYDTTAVNILNALSKAHWGNNYDKAIEYANQSLQLSEQIGYKKGTGNAYNSLGVINKQNGNYSQALSFNTRALKIGEEIGDKAGIAFSYLNIGNVYLTQGNHFEALKNYFAALKIGDEIGDKLNIASTYNNIGIIYDVQKNYPEALKNYYTALKVFKETGSKKYIATMYLNIGGIYALQGNYDEAFSRDSAALKIAVEIGFKYGVAEAYYNIGNVYSAKNNYTEALQSYFKASVIFEQVGDVLDKAECYLKIGIAYSKQKKYNEASSYLNKALSLSKEIGSLEDIELSHEALAVLDSAQGNFQQALQHYKLFVSHRDSLLNNENTKKTTEQQMQFDFDKKQVEDSLQFAQEKEIGIIKLQKQTALTYGGFGGIAIAIILLFFVYNNYTKQRSANKQLKEAQEQLIKSEKMAAFGVMASRVSHEIQNPLNFVNNFSELSQEMLTDVITSTNEEDKKQNTALLFNNLQKINEQGKRASEIVKLLQEHSRKGSAHEYFEENNTGKL
jgi:tetratricopeptide (TPR) repeat protein